MGKTVKYWRTTTKPTKDPITSVQDLSCGGRQPLYRARNGVFSFGGYGG